MTEATWRADGLGLQQVRGFCLVYRLQSYAQAARRLSLSVPTVWEQVRAVERQYGGALFERSGREIRPTALAELLYSSLHPLLAGFDSTFELVREQAGEGPSVITFIPGVRSMLEELGRPLKKFRDRYPQVRLRILHGDDREAQQRVASGEADLAMRLEPAPGVVLPSIEFEPAYALEYLAVLPKRDPLARRASIRLPELVSRPLVVGHPESHGRQLLEQALHREGLRSRLQVAVETDNSAFVMAAVRAGLGIGIVGGRPGGFLARRLAVRSLRGEMGQARMVFLLRRGRRLTRTLRDLIDCIRSAAGEATSSSAPGSPGRGRSRRSRT